ncbi:unnamed protein product [Cuscuta campestris]|uniref:Retrotransposon gag domain-containing protein n=1 Tax=Cuscuta campestris TaxID=132261 RepID=A0A484LCD7_9ASTE|nr:unnamed protein product [Cuscuta campestris]
MSNTSNNLSNEELLASNAALKPQVEYLAKQVAQLTKLKMSMVNTSEERDDDEEVALEANSSNTTKGENHELGATDFKVDIPTFEGKNDLDDFLEWLETVECVFDFKDVPEEKKVKIVALKFRKYASTWWSNLFNQRRRENKAPVKTWLKMRSLLKKKFLPEQYVRDNFARFQHLRQGPLSVEDYNREFQELLMRPTPNSTGFFLEKDICGFSSASIIIFSFNIHADLRQLHHPISNSLSLLMP